MLYLLDPICSHI